MREPLASLIDLIRLIRKYDGINDKAQLTTIVAEKFGLTRDRSVYYCDQYAVRFSSSSSEHFSNTVLSLSNLRKVDDRPFIVCLVTPTQNICLIANTTFLKKVSHSSQALRVNNIRGSFNGSDIMRTFEGIENRPENLARLFDIHAGVGFDDNLPRLVEATNNISPSGVKFGVDAASRANILSSPSRATRFMTSPEASNLKSELDAKVAKYTNEILLAAMIENVNVRGRVIEYLIAGDDEGLRQSLVDSLTSGADGLPAFRTENTLGDYRRQFDRYDTETDIKTKILISTSNPKGYYLDKMLQFLSCDRSVFLFYFVGVDPGRTVKTALVSMSHRTLLNGTLLLRHWSGRNSRGVSQLEGRAINELVQNPVIAVTDVDEPKARGFLAEIISLQDAAARSVSDGPQLRRVSHVSGASTPHREPPTLPPFH